jgi:hypothetical protein
MESKMITAKELFYKMLEENDECTSVEMMIEFAKLHVTEALKSAVYDAETEHCDFGVKEESILNAYPLYNIK